MRYIFPIILIIASIASFLVFTNSTYSEVKQLKAEAAQYDEALSNSVSLQQERDALNTRYRSFSPDSLARLTKMLPDTADNIRLIIDLQRMAQSYNMNLSNINFESTGHTAQAGTGQLAAVSATDVLNQNSDYGTFDLEFTTAGSYSDFLKFLQDIESNLRLTDVSSIEFDAGDGTTPIKYTIKVKTYWLKG